MSKTQLSNCRRIYREKGFSLIEFGLVMIVSGLMLAGALGVYTTYVQKAKLETTYKRLYDANTMMAEAWRVDNRYYCPADPTLQPQDENYGKEIASCATLITQPAGTCDGGVCVSMGDVSANGEGRVLTGMLPFKTIVEQFNNKQKDLARDLATAKDPAVKEQLRLALNRSKKTMSLSAKEMAFDGWGNQLTYMVSAAWTKAPAATGEQPRGSGSIIVMDEEGKRASSKGVQFALISHGVNGNGAYSAFGKRNGGGCAGFSAVEQENCNGDATIIRPAVHTRANNAQQTDDLVAYNVTTSSELWERVPCGDGEDLCLRNRNVQNVAVGNTTAVEKLTVAADMRAENLQMTAKLAANDAGVCDDAGGNCFSPKFIGGDALEACSDTAATNKRILAQRFVGGTHGPALSCKELTMPAYGVPCPADQVLRGFNDGAPVCYNPCHGNETVDEQTVACPTGTQNPPSNSMTYSSYYSCDTREYGDYATADVCSVVAINGICGASNGKDLTSEPTINLCKDGPEPGAYPGDANGVRAGGAGWVWGCAGRHGGTTASCGANKPVNGSCGSANGSTFMTAPSGGSLCKSGTAAGMTGSGPWSWRCNGAHNGNSVVCSASKTPTDSYTCSGTQQTKSQPGNRDYEYLTNKNGCGDDFVEHTTNTYQLRNVGPNSYEIWRVYRSGYVQEGCEGAGTIEDASEVKLDAFVGTNVQVTRAVTTPAIPSDHNAADVVVNTADEFVVTYNKCNPLNGICGSANASPTYVQPTTSLCTAGTPTTVAGSGPWSWNCTGQEGGASASCSAPKKEDAVCGSSDGQSFYSTPSSGLCSTGTASGVTGTGPWNWTCAGVNGGIAASCSASKRQDGACGSAHNSNVYSAPSTNLCSVGAASSVTGSGPWNWTCGGVNGGVASSCSANKRIDATCGSANGVAVYSAPSANLCSSGSASAVSGSGPFTWSCTGSSGGTNASCSAPKKQDAVCSTTANACNLGSPTGYNAGSCGGSQTWTCTGVNGGNNASCSQANAACPVNASCGSSNNTCNAGTASGYNAGSCGGSATWTCNGANGGSNASCSKANAACAVNASCGSSNNTCNAGTPSGYNAGSCGGSATWTCNGANGGSNASCSKANGACAVNGSCGSSANTCNSGSASGYNAGSCGGSATWTCNGANGGSNASCSKANGACAVNGSCGSSANTCNSGSATGYNAGSCGGSATWTCAGANGGSNASCSKANGACAVNGACPGAGGAVGSCSSGSPTGLSYPSCDTTSWQCVGSNGGSTDTCTRYTGGCGGGGGGGGCFTGTTLVTLEDGSRKPIAALEIGDRVKGHTQVNSVNSNKPFYVKSLLYKINGSPEAYVTANHPFFTKEGWKALDVELARKDHPGLEINQLKIGDILLNEKGEDVVLETFEAEDHGWLIVYNPTMDGDHTYYADGLLMHNLLQQKEKQ